MNSLDALKITTRSKSFLDGISQILGILRDTENHSIPEIQITIKLIDQAKLSLDKAKEVYTLRVLEEDIAKELEQ